MVRKDDCVLPKSPSEFYRLYSIKSWWHQYSAFFALWLLPLSWVSGGEGGDLKLPISDWGVNDSNPVNALTVCRRWVSGYGPRFIVWITLEECELQRLKCRIRKLSRDFFTPLFPTTATPKLIFALEVCVGKVWLMMTLFIIRETLLKIFWTCYSSMQILRVVYAAI